MDYHPMAHLLGKNGVYLACIGDFQSLNGEILLIDLS